MVKENRAQNNQPVETMESLQEDTRRAVCAMESLVRFLMDREGARD